MEEVIMLKHLKKMVHPPNPRYERDYLLVWARKVLPEEGIYEISLMDPEHFSYTGWYVGLDKEVGFKYISCATQATEETLAIRELVKIKESLVQEVTI